jgi:aspartate carbamoyltransferase regulatory subunit
MKKFPNDEYKLSIGEIEEGIVLDHIKAGNAMTIYRDLKLGKLDCGAH